MVFSMVFFWFIPSSERFYITMYMEHHHAIHVKTHEFDWAMFKSCVTHPLITSVVTVITITINPCYGSYKPTQPSWGPHVVEFAPGVGIRLELFLCQLANVSDLSIIRIKMALYEVN